RRHTHFQTVPQRLLHRGIGESFGVPARRENAKRERDEYRVVEREQRQEQHRYIEERQIENRIGEKTAATLSGPAPPLRHHFVLATAMRIACTVSSVTMATAAMLAIANAAPSGQLPILLNCTSITLAIITPPDPPTSDGVT